MPIHEKKVRADLHSMQMRGRMYEVADLRSAFYPHHSALSTRPSKSSLSSTLAGHANTLVRCNSDLDSV